MYRPSTKRLSLIWAAICALMLCAPEFTQALEYNIEVTADKSVKKIVITNSFIDDERLGGKFKNNRIEIIYSDGTKTIVIDRCVDGKIDDRITERIIDGTKIIETDWDNNGKLDARRIEKTVDGKTTTEVDWYGDGTVDHRKTERMVDGAKITSMMIMPMTK